MGITPAGRDLSLLAFIYEEIVMDGVSDKSLDELIDEWTMEDTDDE